MIEDLKKTLWATADKLRANMDAAEYKHLVLGLIFLKYISDTFQARRAELAARFADPADEYHLEGATPADTAAELEDRDYYRAANVFWVPEAARWETIRAAAKQPDIGRRIDDALGLIEAENAKLKGILDKRFARVHLPDGKLGELVDLISTIGFGESAATARDVLGQVYEYFLGMFASAEGKRGGQFYTPRSIVKTLVAVLAPHHGKVYDPCCGSGGMFVQSEEFILSHGGKLGDVAIFGQEANPTTWRLAAMNLAIRGIDFNLGREPADTFTKNQFPDLRADFILANPPFNVSDWWHASLSGDARWVYGDPPQGNANYAWLQHMLWHLKPGGRAGIVLANGSMSSSQNNEGHIRAAMVEADVVEVMIALPGQLFFNTQIPACLWFLVKDKRQRRGEVLFIDARKLATMISRVQCELKDGVIERIAGTVAAWRGEAGAGEYADVAGYCRSVRLAEIAEHGHVLTPGRYVRAEAVEDDDEGFEAKMQALTERLGEQMAKGAELDDLIRRSSGSSDMASESATLRSFVSLVRGTTYKGELVGQPGPVLLGLASIQPDGGFRRGSFKTYGGESPAKITLGPGDIYVSLKDVTQSGDLLGSVARVPGDIAAGRLTQDTVKLQFDGKPVRQDYVYWLLRTPAYRAYCRSHATGTTTLGFARDDFLNFPVVEPSEEDLSLIDLLEALDDRIALLRETNATLEAIAQALFKSWFVDFDPVRAKSQGLAPAGMNEATAALFPDGFEESVLGPLPHGWRVGSILEVADLLSGGTPRTDRPEFWGGDIAWASAKDVSQSSGSVLVSTERSITPMGLERSATRLIPRLATVVVARGATTGRMVMLGREMAMNQTCYGLTSKLDVPVGLHCLLRREIDALVNTAHGSVFDTITTSTFTRSIVVHPPTEVLARFESIGRPLFEQIAESTARVQTLTALRDALLPRLISGQLRLPEAIAEAEEAL